MTAEMPTSTLTDTLGGEVLRMGSTLYVLNRLGCNYWWATFSAAGEESMPPEKHEATVEAMRVALNGHDALKAENERLRDILRKLSNAVLGKLPFMEPQVREDFGEENYDLLMGRAVEARAALTQERA